MKRRLAAAVVADHKKREKCTLQVVGFDHHERLLLASFFRIVQGIQEWHPGQTKQPDCVLLDIDSEAGRDWRRQELARPCGMPVIVVGDQEEQELMVLAQLPRPFQVGNLLRALNGEAFSIDGGHAGASDSLASLGQDAAGLPEAAASSASASSDAGQVLIINPGRVGARYVTSRLTQTGYRVDLVSCGMKALAMVEANRYRGVIMEPVLPDMDGFELCRRIKRHAGAGGGTAAIILTASRHPFDRVKATLAGCDAYLTRPVAKAVLDDVLEKYLPTRARSCAAH